MKKNILALSLILVFFLALSIFSQTQVLPQAQESISVTTYYPAPYGVYKQMETESLGVGDTNNDGTINGADVPANPGDVWIAGDVGIGGTNPQARLDVDGGVKIDDDTRSCSSAIAGTIRYHNGTLEYCDAIEWRSAFGGTCPAGYVDTGVGVCIELDQRPPAQWQNAVGICANAGAFLCPFEQWAAACVQGNANNMVGDWEWTPDITDNIEEGLAVGLSSCTAIEDDADTDSAKAFRCCVSIFR